MFSSNFIAFDIKAKKAMLLMMHITSARPMKIQTASFVKFEVSLDIFLKVNRIKCYMHLS